MASARRTSDWKKRAYSRVVARDGELCSNCTALNQDALGREGYLQKSLHLDHVVALVDGGSNEDDNLQLLCGFCHKRKTGLEKRRRSERRWCNSGLGAYAEVLL